MVLNNNCMHVLLPPVDFLRLNIKLQEFDSVTPCHKPGPDRMFKFDIRNPIHDEKKCLI